MREHNSALIYFICHVDMCHWIYSCFISFVYFSILHKVSKVCFVSQVCYFFYLLNFPWNSWPTIYTAQKQEESKKKVQDFVVWFILYLWEKKEKKIYIRKFVSVVSNLINVVIKPIHKSIRICLFCQLLSFLYSWILEKRNLLNKTFRQHIFK